MYCSCTIYCAQVGSKLNMFQNFTIINLNVGNSFRDSRAYPQVTLAVWRCVKVTNRVVPNQTAPQKQFNQVYVVFEAIQPKSLVKLKYIFCYRIKVINRLEGNQYFGKIIDRLLCRSVQSLIKRTNFDRSLLI